MPIISPKIPQGLEELMKGLAKSVIKENPDNIYEFAAEYFENLLRERDGSVADQNYKKFATYKVYKKSRTERRKRGKESSSNIDDGNLKLQQVSSLDDKISSVERDDSIEKITLADCEQQRANSYVSKDIITSTESEIKATVQQDSFVDDEGTPQQKSVNSEEGDNKSLLLSDEKHQAEAAVKIQSTFRGHRVRREMKGNENMKSNEENAAGDDEMGNDNIIISDDICEDMQGNKDDENKEQSDKMDGDDMPNENEELNLNNESKLKITDSTLNNANEPECGDVNEEAEIQLTEMEINENTEQLEDEINMGGVEGEINLENCSTEANENEFNDGEIAFDAKLSTDLTCTEEEQLQSSVENNIQEENLQAENVPLMEAESNIEQIVINESSQDIENIEINPDGEKEGDKTSGDVSGDEQQAQIDNTEGPAVNNLEESESLKEENDDLSTMVVDDEIEEAALKIQSAFRGHQVRKDIKEQNASAIDSPSDNPIESEQNGQEITVNDIENTDMEIVSNEEVKENSSVEQIASESIDNEQIAEIDDGNKNFNENSKIIERNSVEKASDESVISTASVDEKIESETPLSQEIVDTDAVPLEAKSIEENNGSEITPENVEPFEENMDTEAVPSQNDSADENVEKEITPLESLEKVEVNENHENLNEIAVDILAVSENEAEFPSDEQDNKEEGPFEEEAILSQDESNTEQPESEQCEALVTESVQLSTNDNEVNQYQSQEHSKVSIANDSRKNSTEQENLNKEENEEQQFAEDNIEKASPTNINYEQLRDSTDSLEKVESNVTTNEDSIDVDSKSIDSKNSFTIDTQEQESSVQPEIQLENILAFEISPYELFDEVVNQEAAVRAMEMTPLSEDDDIKNMVLDDEMEQAALKIQSSFRGHKVRKERKNLDDQNDEPIPSTDVDTANEDDDIKNMVLDDEMEQAALKIQSSFRGHKVRKERNNLDDQNDEPIPSTDVDTANEDDDIKNMVLDDEMEQAALKIQSSFRGHKVRKERKDVLDQKEDDDNAHPIKSTESFLDSINESDIEQITKPELLDLSVDDKNETDDNDKVNDEILSPDQAESEIPEENNEPSNDILFPEQGNCNDDKPQDIDANESLNNEKDKENQSEPKDEENVEDMILDDEMEDAALKIQAAFRGHQVRKLEYSVAGTDQEETSKNESNEIIIEQCSEGNEEIQENDETEQQDTSADVDEIQESEAVEQEENETEEAEEAEEANDAEQEEETTETNEQGGDDPEEPEQAEGESSTQQQSNDDDDVANMVLDEEMEQAALKIQSTFRGQKSRAAKKPKEEEKKEVTQEDPVQNIDDEIANMVLDDEMEQAALKIQSAFRGNKAKKDGSEKDSAEEKPDEDEKESEQEKKEEEPTGSEGSSGKTAQQLQEEEDIANLVMDEEMEKTALKIQSAFRGKIKKKSQKDDDSGSYESEDYNADAEGSFQKSEENPSDMYEYFGVSVECDEDCDNGYIAQRDSYADGGNYSIERDNAMSAYNETIYPSESEADVDLMHGGGIFPETSGESVTMESMADYMSEGNNRNDPPEDKKDISKRLSESSVNGDEQVENETEEKAIESFDFDSNKDTAEAMYYSLKKNEMEAQKRFESKENEDSRDEQEDMPNNEMNEPEKEQSPDIEDFDNGSDDNDDVVVSPLSNDVQKLKYGMSMDDRLLGSILSQDYSKGRKVYPDEMFDPLLEEAMSKNYNMLEKLHELSRSEEERKIDDNNVGEEDQFDDFYPGNIRSKIMASSISIADSDYFDPTNNKSIIDDDRIRTALETIHSTDSESTIGSAATKIQAGNLTAHRNKNFQYSSIGNAAIDRSLDEFIQSQELKIDRFEEEPEGYYSPPPKKQESADDFTDDTCTESEKRPTMAGIIEIKLEQKNFLTIDERRRTLHREDAIQRNSTRSVDDDTSKSTNASHEKILGNKSSSQSDVTASLPELVQGQSSVVDTEIPVPVLEKQKSSISKTFKVPMRRQKTMPVQIESNVIRVLPKHLRKRIRSADSDKKKRTSK